MKYVGGNPLFTNDITKKDNFIKLNSNINCDVAIIGGGVTGALCAYFFLKKGINCILIEDNLIGQSSTSICTSILEYEIDIDLINLSDQIGEDSAITAFKLGRDAVFKIEEIINEFNINCDFKITPCFYYSINKDDIHQFKSEFKARKAAGFDITYLNKDEAKLLYPFNVECGLLTQNAAATFNPYDFTLGLLKALKSKGLKVYENTRLTKTIHDSNECVVLDTSTGYSVTANKILNCTGYAANKMFKENLSTFTRTFNIATSPLNSTKELWNQNSIIIDNSTPYYYCRTTGDNRIILGGEDIPDLDYNEDKINEAYNQLTSKLKILFPDLDNYTIDFKYNGVFADSKNSIPYIGTHEDFPNHYFCLGYGSNGVLYSTFGGEMLANLHIGKKDANMDIFRFNR
ncbi:MAG: NAD(P)/FAD-dependent oxidoreductase [Clostridium sp.]